MTESILLFCLSSVLCHPASDTWSWRWDLNPQPPDYKSGALPIELRQHEPEKYIRKSEKINSFFIQTVIKKAGGKIPSALQAKILSESFTLRS